jgi:hypothetical protein
MVFNMFQCFQGFFKIFVKVFQCFTMFEGDSAVTCSGKFPLVSMGGRAEGAQTDPEARIVLVPLCLIINFLFPDYTLISIKSL